MCNTRIWVAIALTSLTTTVQAQTCSALADDKARLACYDRSNKPKERPVLYLANPFTAPNTTASVDSGAWPSKQPAPKAPATKLEAAMRDLVQGRGFNCAQLLSVQPTLDDEYGRNYMVTCYFSGRGATYRVTIQPNSNILVKLEHGLGY